MADLGAIASQPAQGTFRALIVSPKIYPLILASGTPAVVLQQPLEIDAGGTLGGVVKIAGVATGGVLVGLFHRPTMQMLQRAWTAADGSYSFRGLDRAAPESYFAVALDPASGAPWSASGVHDRLSAG